jgi:hypothetical protein
LKTIQIFENILPVSGVILALVPALSVAITGPLMNYSVTTPSQIGNTSIFDSKITVTNAGLQPAKNVIVSVIVDNVSVISINSEPYLPNNTQSFTSDVLNQPGRGIFRIDKLVPQATMTLDMKMDSHGFKNAKLIVYVQSDETVGYHGVVYLVLAYLVVAFTLAFISVYAFIPINGKTKTMGVGLYVPGAFCIITTGVLIYLILYT